MTIQITSKEFSEGGNIPKRFSCDGEKISPALSWSGIPSGTKSLALIVHDPDAPVGDFVHWVIFNIDPNQAGLPEGFSQGSKPINLGVQGRNSYAREGYGPPCPPKGSTHRYLFNLHALDTMLDLSPGSSRSELEKSMQGHILASGQLIGMYGR